MHDVVITAGTAVGSVLALAEAIKTEFPCKVFVLCTDEKTSLIISSSKFVDEIEYIASNENPEYVEAIQHWFKDQSFTKKPVLYSTTDSSCYFIDEHREWFDSNFLLSIPSSDIIKSFTQKGVAEFVAEHAGLSIPKTAVLKHLNEVEKILSDFYFPVILKPRATYMKGSIDFKIKVLTDYRQALAVSRKYLVNGNELLCQEFIPGASESSYYYLFYRSQNGVVSSSMGIKTLQSSKDGGIMLKGKSLFNKELDAQCRMFLKNIDYFGMGGIEFKKSGDTFYFIEMSVRLEGFYKMAEATGVPLSLISFRSLTDSCIKNKTECIKQEDGIVYITWLPAMINYIKNKQLFAVFKDTFLSILNSKYIVNAFSIRSPSPFLKEIYFALFGKNK